jgi:uncharacterized delta-60 repeat protein
MRLDASGAIDASYGRSGGTIVTFDRVLDSVPDSRGGIAFLGHVLLGEWRMQKSRVVLKRLDDQGQEDTGFFATALGVLDCPGLPAERATAGKLAVQPDGKLLVAQAFTLGTEAGSNRVCISRVNQDGTLDAAYGGMGHAQIDDPLVAFDGIDLLALFVADNGSATLAVARQAGDPSLPTYSFVVIALTPNGAVDATRLNRGFAGPSDTRIAKAGAVAVDEEGKVVVAGFPGIGTAPSWQGIDAAHPRLERLGLNGLSDPTFGPDGQGYQSLATSRYALDAMHIRVAGKAIFVSGAASEFNGTTLMSRKYLAVAKFAGGEQ